MDLSCWSAFSSLKFVDCDDLILDSPCQALTIEEIKNPNMQLFFDGMLSFAKGQQSDQQKHVLVGLSAPQIGVPLRIILVDVKADGKGGVSEARLYINPEITEQSKETEQWYEACFSTGRVKGVVNRSSQIDIKALDRYGNEVQETHQGYVARIFLHEVDHLDGIRFPDRMDAHERLHIVETNEMYQYRNEQGWWDWKITISQKDWKKHMRQIDKEHGK